MAFKPEMNTMFGQVTSLRSESKTKPEREKGDERRTPRGGKRRQGGRQ